MNPKHWRKPLKDQRRSERMAKRLARFSNPDHAAEVQDLYIKITIANLGRKS